MAGATDRNVNVRITSSFDGSGLTAAERASFRMEQRERRLVNMQTQAAREMAATEQRKASIIEAANARQAAAMTAVGRSITIASLAAAAGLALTAKAAMDWETAFAGVRKTVDGSDEEIAALEQELRGLAKILPATHQEIAAVAEAAGQLGVARKDVTEFTRTMIALGETTNLTAEEAASGLAKFSNVMGESNAAAGRLGSTIVDLGNNAATTEADILAMGQRIAGAGRTAGLSSAQVLGVASALSSVGIEAEAGGTAISRVMLQIASDVQSGSDRVEAYARVTGVSAEQFAQAWREDAGGALSSFIEGLGEMQAAGGNTTAVLDEMGFSSVRISDTLRRSALAGDKFRESLDRAEGAYGANIALAEEFNKRLETTEARLGIARNNINDAAIDIGANLLPALASGADAVANLAAGFGAMPDSTKSFVTNLGLVVTGLGLLVGGAATVIPKVQQLKVTIDALSGGTSLMGKALGGTLSFLTGPWGLALAGAAVAVAVLTSVIGANARKQEEMRREAQSLAQTMDEVTGAVTENTRQQVINNLVTEEAFDLGEKYGQSASDVADAVFGSAESFEEWRSQILAANEGTGAHIIDLNTLIETIESQRAALEEAGVVWEQTGEAQDAAAGATRDATGEIEDQVAAIDDLIDATDELNGASQSLVGAEIDWQEQLAKTTAEIAKGTKTLDISTEAGRANAKTMLDMAREGQSLAEARLRQNGNEQQYRQTLEQVRESLLKNARQFFATEEEAQAYVDTLLRTPANVSTSVQLTGVEKVEAALARLSAPRVAYITTAVRNAVNTYGGPDAYMPSWAQADGGVMEFYASGGMRENHVAQFAPAGAMRVWAEPETGGEAYIPLAPAKRARSLDIWAETGQRLGVGAQGGGGVTFNAPVYSHSPGELASTITTRMRDANAAHGIGSIAAGVG